MLSVCLATAVSFSLAVSDWHWEYKRSNHATVAWLSPPEQWAEWMHILTIIHASKGPLSKAPWVTQAHRNQRSEYFPEAIGPLCQLVSFYKMKNIFCKKGLTKVNAMYVLQHTHPCEWTEYLNLTFIWIWRKKIKGTICPVELMFQLLLMGSVWLE